MVQETVWVEKKYVRPRLSPDELWLIPNDLLSDNPWTITIDDVPKADYTKTDNGTQAFIYFTYTQASISYIIIEGTWVVPEFPSFLILPLFMIATLPVVIAYRRKRIGIK